MNMRLLPVLLLIACSGRPNVAPGTLVVEPNPIVFAELGREDTEVFQTVVLRNSGDETIWLNSFEIEELDPRTELFLENDPLDAAVPLGSGARYEVQVAWRPADMIVDRGRLTIGIRGQLPVAVPIRSPELPAFLSLSSQPMGVASEGTYQLNLDGAPFGGRQAAWLDLTTTTLQPLAVRELCFEDVDGGCTQQTMNGFTICAGRVTQPDGCRPHSENVEVTRTQMLFSTLFFEPPRDTDDLFEARLLVKSNDRDSPEYVVNITAAVCRADGTMTICGTCGNETIDPGEECDDGNRNDEDNCRNNCTEPNCSDPPDSDGDGLADRCDDRPNTPDFTVRGRVGMFGGHQVGTEQSVTTGSPVGRVESQQEQFKHRARIYQ